MSDAPGRVCPLGYRYGAAALATAPERRAETLYVIGGLYGNLLALEAVEALVAGESGAVTLCFNGDFHWFDVDDTTFTEINRRVLCHAALLGNVEAELPTAGEAAGCGCAYPETVDAAVVERSNRIHARLKATARRHPEALTGLGRLSMFARYRIGDMRIGIVHGDAEALAGWRFEGSALDDPAHWAWLVSTFTEADVEIFASSHTCLPVCRHLAVGDRYGWVINNGAAGMPNFAGTRFGVITRIGITPSPHRSLYGGILGAVHIDALTLEFDANRWEKEFLANWPAGSPAYISYFARIRNGPAYSLDRALPRSLREGILDEI
ncbi:MAG: hypothetical protein H6975_07090 [Gammaproteobacteria bacterium]|nr:hypothetical protein [Gammaproteobacteria bacterium]